MSNIPEQNRKVCPGSCHNSGEPFSLAVAHMHPGCINFQEVGISGGGGRSELRSPLPQFFSGGGSAYPHLLKLIVLRPIPVRSLLRDFQSFHSNLWPGASCSLFAIGSYTRCCFAIDLFFPVLKLYAYLSNKGCSWQPESLPEACRTLQQVMYTNWIPSIDAHLWKAG